MAVSNHESSDLDFAALPGIFDNKYPKITPGWLPGGQIPFSGVMAAAVKTIAISPKINADPLLAVGYKGQAGWMKKFGGVDVTVDAVLTDNVNVSGAWGYQLSDFDSMLPSGLIVYTTNTTLGKKATVSGMFVSQIAFSFNQNAESTMSMNFMANGVDWDNYSVAVSGAVGNRDYHCINPLTWDEIHLFDQDNAVVLTGVQRATFTAAINRTDIFQIGQFSPYDRTVVHPYKVTVSLDTLANDVRLSNWWDKFKTSYDPMSDCAGGLIIKLRTNPITGESTARDFIIASGLRPTASTLNIAVGQNSTVTMSFEGSFLLF